MIRASQTIVAARSKNNVLSLGGQRAWGPAADLRLIPQFVGKGENLLITDERHFFKPTPYKLGDTLRYDYGLDQYWSGERVVISEREFDFRKALKARDLAEFLAERPNSYGKIVGDSKLYEAAMNIPSVTFMILVTIDVECEGDDFFPEIDLTQWKFFEEVPVPNTPEGEPAVTVVKYRRIVNQTLAEIFDRRIHREHVTLHQYIEQVISRLETEQFLCEPEVFMLTYKAVQDRLGWNDIDGAIPAVHRAMALGLKLEGADYSQWFANSALKTWAQGKDRHTIIAGLRQIPVDLLDDLEEKRVRYLAEIQKSTDDFIRKHTNRD